jgi:hypothetical protein
MTEILSSLPYIVGALLSVTLIDTVGAVASRRLNFNYGYLTVLSLSVYTVLGYCIASKAGLNMVFIASLLVGFYDATVGFKLSKTLKANIQVPQEIESKITVSHALMIMLFIAPLFAFIGYAEQ